MSRKQALKGDECGDCGEPVTETERKALRWCYKCKVALHAECVMTTPTESDICEVCLYTLNASESGLWRTKPKATA